MSKLSTQIAAVCLAAAMSSLYAQGQSNSPLPTAEMQMHIDVDNSRHFGSSPADPGPLATDLSPRITTEAIDRATRKVADWELQESQPYFDRLWTWSALYVGFMAASESTGDPKYRAAMQAMGEKFEWKERREQPNADDLSVAQTYLELYLDAGKKNPEWIAPTQTEMASIIDLKTLPKDATKIPWWWCDALFMGPPAWVRMYAATGDRKYVDYFPTAPQPFTFGPPQTNSRLRIVLRELTV
jgi:unsaturated rhamnogalacturonyl hydrolase